MGLQYLEIQRLFISMYYLSVSQIKERLSDLAKENFSFLIVKGQISNDVRSPNPNLYFTLQEEPNKNINSTSEDRGKLTNLASINCICWATTVLKLQQQGVLPNNEEGYSKLKTNMVIVKGRIKILNRSLQPVLEVFEIQSLDEHIKSQFAEVREILLQEGLLDKKSKRTISLNPRVIGLITSYQSDAYYDVVKQIDERGHPKILLYHTKVQGGLADLQIKSAIDYFNVLPAEEKPDVIILARGGGSFQDLEPFNSERLARAILASDIPVVTGLGHTANQTVADLVADLACSTPTKVVVTLFPKTLEEKKLELMNLAENLEYFTKQLWQNRYQILKHHISLLPSLQEVWSKNRSSMVAASNTLNQTRYWFGQKMKNLQ